MKATRTITEVKTKRFVEIEDVTKVSKITLELTEREAFLIRGILGFLSTHEAVSAFDASRTRALYKLDKTCVSEIVELTSNIYDEIAYAVKD